MLNGIRINSATGTQHQIDYNFSVKNVKQIEVILGPGSALYGVDAFTGVINIILKETGGETNANVSFDYGNFNTQNSSFHLLTSKNNVNLQVLGNIYHSDEPFFPDYFKDEFSWYTDEYSKNGNVGLPFDENITIPTEIKDYATPTAAANIITQLQFKNFEIGHSLNYQSHNTSYSINPKFAIYAEDATRKFELNTTWFKHLLEKDKWNLASSIFMQNMRLNPNSNFQNFFSGYDPGYKYSRDEVIKLEETWTYNLSEKSKFILGGTAEYDYALANTSDLPNPYNTSVSASQQQMTYLGSDIDDKFGNDLSIYQDFYETTYYNFSTYAQYQTSIKDIYHITLGSRSDYNSRYGSSVNPRAGLVITPNNKLSTKYLYGTAYLAPSPFKTFKHYGSFILKADSTGLTSGFFHLPNPDLKPEQMQSHEVLLSYSPTSALQLTANGFYNKVTNIIRPELAFEEEFKGATIDVVERNKNGGLSETMGVTLGAIGFIKPNAKSVIKPQVNYTFIDGHLDGNPLSYTAKNTLKSTIEFTFQKINSGIAVLHRGHSKAIINGSTFINNPFTLINLNLGYDLLEKKSYTLKVNAKARNLLNTKYYNLAKDDDLITLPLVPQDPIRFYLGLKLSLI